MAKPKQRITRLTARERRAAAAIAGGVIDRRIAPDVQALLSGYSPTTNEKVVNAIAHYRLFEAEKNSTLSNAERKKQAEATADTIREAIDRMSNLDPLVEYVAEDLWFTSGPEDSNNQTFGERWRANAELWLYRAAAIMDKTAKQIPSGSVGRKSDSLINNLLDDLTSALLSDEIKLSKSQARAIAVDIARSCGLTISDRKAEGRK